MPKRDKMSFRAHWSLTSSSHQDILHPGVKQPRWRSAPLNFRYWSSAGKGWIFNTGSKMSCNPKWRSSCMSGSRSEGGHCLPPNLCSNPEPARSHRQPSKTNVHPKTTQSRGATPPCQQEPVEVFQTSGQAATRMPSWGEVCWACPLRCPPDRARACWRDYMSRLAWERHGISQEELVQMAGERRVSLLKL